MPKLHPISVAALALIAAASVALAAAPPQPDYHPSLGDLMTMAVQPRHTKVALAVRARNWTYAAYETDELRNALNRVARTVPTYRNADMAQMVGEQIKEPVEQLAAAIKAKDARRTDAALVRVTAGCNQCHLSLDHAYVMIRAPAGADYPDQDFAAH